MELALLVYVISLLEPLSGFLVFSSFTLGVVAFITWFWYGIGSIERDIGVKWKWPVTATVLFIVVTLTKVLVPTERTAYLMVGAYATQKIAEAPKTKELGAEVLKIIEGKIKFYAEQAEKEMQLKQLQQETGKK